MLKSVHLPNINHTQQNHFMKFDFLSISLRSRAAWLAANKYATSKSTLEPSPFWGGATFAIQRYTFARWCEVPEFYARFEGLAGKIIRLGHNGWYCDDIGRDEIARGVVYYIRSLGYLAAVADPYNADKEGNGPCMFEVNEKGNLFIYDSKEETARNANELAERYAEMAREDNEKQRAIYDLETKVDECQGEIDEARSEAKGLIADIRESKLNPGLCERMKGELRKLRGTMHSASREIKAAKNELQTLNR